MPVLPLVGSTIDGVRREEPGFLGGVDHRHGDAVLHAVGRVEELELGGDLGDRPFAHPPKTDERRVPDQLGDVVCDVHVRALRSGFCPPY